MAPSGMGSAVLAAAGRCAVAITGCSHFEHPLTWDESPVAKGSAGSGYQVFAGGVDLYVRQ